MRTVVAHGCTSRSCKGNPLLGVCYKEESSDKEVVEQVDRYTTAVESAVLYG
jgi:hypothetical protein